MRDFPVPWIDLARRRPVRQAGAALLAALYALRVALEFALPPVVRPDDALPLVLLAAILGGAAGFGLARASGVAWPALLLLIYALYPALSPEAAGVAGVLALAAWLAARALPDGWAWDAAVLLAALAVYVGAAAPGVLPADAGEFQLVVNELGVAHPPGYPLYTLVGWGFAQLPLGSPAYRVNLFSALTAALTLAVVSHAVRRETCAPVAGLAAALALGAATSFWLTATQASIRPMAALFTALALDALLAYRRATRRPHPGGTEAPGSQAAQGAGRENRILARFALCVGLGLTHHASLVFVAAVFVAALVAADRALLRQPRRWLRPGLAFAAGFLPWLYLPLRAGAALAPADINTWDGFWNHVLARGFEGDLFVFAPLARLPVMGEVLTYQWHGLVLAAGAAAALLMLWRDRWLLATLGGAFALHTLVTATYRAPQTVEYMTPAYVCLAAAVGWFVGALASRKLQASGKLAAVVRRAVPLAGFLSGCLRAFTSPLNPLSTRGEGTLPPADSPSLSMARGPGGEVLASLVAAVVILGGALTFAANLPSLLYLHADEEARDFATRLLDETPDGAALLANWHRVTPLWYLQGVEGQRPDVEVVYVYPDGAEPLGATWARRIGAYLEAGRPVVVQSHFPDAYATTGYRFAPQVSGPGWTAYAAPRRTLPAGFAPLEPPVPFEGGVTLRSAPALHAPGGYAPATVALAWEVADGDVAGGDVTSFLHAVAGETVVRQDDVPLPTARAEPGEIVVARYTLDRPPGDLALLAGLYTAGAEGVMPLRAEDGRARVPVGALEAVAPVPLPPPTEHPRYDAFADGLVLTGYDYDLSLPGRARLYLHWTYRGAGWADFDLTLSRADTVLGTERFRATAGGHFSTAYDLLPDAAGVRVAIEAAGCGCLSQTLGPFGVRTGYGVDLPGPEPGARYVPLGSGVVLTGVQVSAPAALQPGDRVDVALRFRAAYPLPEDDVVKVDLIGPNWAWRAQSDHIPATGAIPTLKWVWGSAVTDWHTLTVPDGVAAAGARLELALYDHFTQRPLPILDPALAAQGQTLTIWMDVLQ